MRLFKYIIVSMTIFSLVNCAPKDLASKANEANSQAEQNNSSSDTQLASASDLTILSSPIPAIAMPDVKVPENSGNFLSNLFGGLFGGNGSGPSAKGCGLLSAALGIGGTLLLGNPIFGAIGSKLPGLLFNCGNSADFSGLIPNGASGQDQIFQLLGHILKIDDQGKNPFSVITQIKKPEDVTAMIGILGQLVGKTGTDPKLKSILDKFLQYQSYLNQGTTSTCGSMDPVACRVFGLINQIRADHNLPDFQFSPGCADASQAHTFDMALNNVFSHLSTNGNTVSQRLAKYGIGSPWAENIIKGKSLTAEKAVELWMQSPQHKKNILSNLFTTTGIGYMNGYFTQCFNKN